MAPEIGTCTPCDEYFERRGSVVGPLLTDENSGRFINGVHERHEAGLSLQICAGCGTTPDETEFAGKNRCQPCVGAAVRAARRNRVLYSLMEVAL